MKTQNEIFYICDFCGYRSLTRSSVEACESHHRTPPCKHLGTKSFDCDQDVGHGPITVFEQCADCKHNLRKVELNNYQLTPEQCQKILEALLEKSETEPRQGS